MAARHGIERWALAAGDNRAPGDTFTATPNRSSAADWLLLASGYGKVGQGRVTGMVAAAPNSSSHRKTWFRRTWATNDRKHQVGDLFSLQQEGGWEDLEVPQRFYVDTSLPRENRASVMDHLALEQRKDALTRRKAPIQMVEAVQQVQVVETRPKPRLGAVQFSAGEAGRWWRKRRFQG